MKRLGLVLFGFVALHTATAAPIYRCGQSYSQTPCPGGKLIDSADPRTAAQRAEARRVSEREKKLAARMEQDRVSKENGEKPASASGFDSRAASTPAPASAPVKSQKKRTKGKGKAATDKDFVAVEPGAQKNNGK
ncbi:hypothetical protein [Piscinibacter sp. XHJ-5]|uniref:hypothetical protein n=1 Tax=Piscinibacter sp. XHJ-5 TaxID=3037797 RepID=UPI0024530D8E|nr:hypothetical protein [Piscinibacter sp. XHJ-5]